MKKLFLLAAGLALTLTACQKDEGLVSGGADYQTITVTLPQSMQTRATADDFGGGTLVDRCLLQVYRNNQPYGEQQVATVTGKTATFTLRLVASQTYDFVFWADCSTGDHYATEDLTNITVKGDYTGNNDEFDAFTGNLLGYNVTGAFQENITLRRPFGQLNVKTLDLASIPDASLKPTQVKVAFTALPTTFNAQTGLVGEQSAAVEYTADVLSENGDLTVDYIWAPVEEATLADFAITFYNGATEISTNGDFKNIPVRRNYRTNVSGNLLTKQGTFNVVIDPIFETPDIDVDAVANVASAEDLIKALSLPVVETIHVESDIDLSAATVEELTFSTHKTFEIEAGNTIQLGNKNWLTAEAGLTLTGGGTIDNTSADNSDLVEGSNHYQKSLIHVTGGECLIDGVTLINDPDYHWHSSVDSAPYNSSAIAYWNDAEVTVKNAHIVSGEFTVCGMGRGGVNTGKVTLVDSYFESTSSNVHNGKNWAYAMRLFGSEVVIENCEVKGIQGAVSIEECVKAEIRSGKFYTVNTPGKNDAFYPLYVTGGAVVTITGGEFIGARDWSGGLAEGTSAVACGDNDTGLPNGSVTLKGGKFSGKAYNHETSTVYDPVEGYQWQAIEDDPSGLKWEVVPVE